MYPFLYPIRASSRRNKPTQFVFLLVLFVKPLLVRVEGTQSAGADYRRVVIKNLICTGTIVTAYLITTVVMVFALLQGSPNNNTVGNAASSLY